MKWWGAAALAAAMGFATQGWKPAGTGCADGKCPYGVGVECAPKAGDSRETNDDAWERAVFERETSGLGPAWDVMAERAKANAVDRAQ